jgi:Aspartate ammonia-lyase
MSSKTEDYRVERDFLGEKHVPLDAYFGVQTMRAVDNFPITGYHIDDELINAMAVIKKSAALANSEIGQLNEKIAQAIVTAADEILKGEFHDQFVLDPIQGGAGTSVNMNTNEVIANRALEILGEEKGNYKVVSPNSHVNMSQSTNDSYPTAIHLSALFLLEKLLKTLEKYIMIL